MHRTSCGLRITGMKEAENRNEIGCVWIGEMAEFLAK